MPSWTWLKTEGVTDTENECDSIAAQSHDLGIEVAYMSCGELRTVVVQGVFEVCPMAATGYTQEQIIETLLPGWVAIPVRYRTTAVVLKIGPDYDVAIVDENDVVPEDISVVDIDENPDIEEVDDEVRTVLGLV